MVYSIHINPYRQSNRVYGCPTFRYLFEHIFTFLWSIHIFNSISMNFDEFPAKFWTTLESSVYVPLFNHTLYTCFAHQYLWLLYVIIRSTLKNIIFPFNPVQNTTLCCYCCCCYFMFSGAASDAYISYYTRIRALVHTLDYSFFSSDCDFVSVVNRFIMLIIKLNTNICANIVDRLD